MEINMGFSQNFKTGHIKDMTQLYQCWIVTYRNFSQYITEIPDYPFYHRTIYNTKEMELNYMMIVMTHEENIRASLMSFKTSVLTKRLRPPSDSLFPNTASKHVSFSASLVVGEHETHTELI